MKPKTQVKVVWLQVMNRCYIRTKDGLYAYWNGELRPAGSACAYFSLEEHATAFARGHGWEVVTSFKRKITAYRLTSLTLTMEEDSLRSLLTDDVELEVIDINLTEVL